MEIVIICIVSDISLIHHIATVLHFPSEFNLFVFPSSVLKSVTCDHLALLAAYPHISTHLDFINLMLTMSFLFFPINSSF